MAYDHTRNITGLEGEDLNKQIDITENLVFKQRLPKLVLIWQIKRFDLRLITKIKLIKYHSRNNSKNITLSEQF
jgi:hypothetical protein